jgi:hypothetical protein
VALKVVWSGLACGLADKLLRLCDTGMVSTPEVLTNPDRPGTCSRDANEIWGNININTDERTLQLLYTQHTTLIVSIFL